MKLFKLLRQSLFAPRPLSLKAARDEERLLAAGHMLAVVTGQPVLPYSTRNFGRERYADACSVLLPPDKLMSMLRAMRVRLPQGLLAFVGTSHSMARPAPGGLELVVAQGLEQFDILRVAATAAPRLAKTTEQLIQQLRAWHAAYGIDIWQAESDTVQLQLRSMPTDLLGFAQEVYAFCPSAVEQGMGSVEAMAAAIRQTRALYLWWD